MSSEKYIGLDVHQATISVAVVDSQGKVVMDAIGKLLARDTEGHLIVWNLSMMVQVFGSQRL